MASQAKHQAMPSVIRTMQPVLASAVPRGPRWVHEVTHDGWRIVAQVQDGDVRLASQSGRGYTREMAVIANALAKLQVHDAIIDGEIAAPDSRGTARPEVRRALYHPKLLAYFAFDLLWLNGEDLRTLPLLDRKRRLATLMRGVSPRLIYVEHAGVAQRQGLYDAAIASGDGIISKRVESQYWPGPRKEWVKVKPPGVRARQAE